MEGVDLLLIPPGLVHGRSEESLVALKGMANAWRAAEPRYALRKGEKE